MAGISRRLTAFTRMSDLEGKREFAFPDIRGWKVVNPTGHEVGVVEEVFVDPNSLEPMMALLHYRKFLNRNTKKLLVPWSELQFVGGRQVRTRPAEADLESAPEWLEEATEWEPIADYWHRRSTAGDTRADAIEDEISIRA